MSFDPAFKLFAGVFNQERHDTFDYTESDMQWVFESPDSEPISKDLKFNFNSLKLRERELKVLQFSQSELDQWSKRLKKRVGEGKSQLTSYSDTPWAIDVFFHHHLSALYWSLQA